MHLARFYLGRDLGPVEKISQADAQKSAALKGIERPSLTPKTQLNERRCTQWRNRSKSIVEWWEASVVQRRWSAQGAHRFLCSQTVGHAMRVNARATRGHPKTVAMTYLASKSSSSGPVSSNAIETVIAR